MIDAVVKELWVPATPEAAFSRFTDELNTWWPRPTHSVSQDRCRSVAFQPSVGGRLLEVDADGAEHLWGTVQVWDPPHRFQVTWHPGRGPEEAQRVEVTFTAHEGGTTVQLTHSGWEILGAEAQEMRGRYDGGWATVLDLFGASVDAPAI